MAEDYSVLKATLCNESGTVPLAKRFRALFALRGLGTTEAITIIGSAFKDASALLGHELAYCLGQIGKPEALPILEEVLKNENEHPMVRHEAAEALGAISSPDSLPILRHFRDKQGENAAVVETCEIAVAKVEYDHGLGRAEATQRSIYDSIDPAPPLSMHDTAAIGEDVPALRKTLLDPSLSLFQRYRAMFALRNLASLDYSQSHSVSKAAVLALADGFADPSALFRHEIAYIFGQLSSEHSVPSLIERLEDEKEDDMVRHEAAEALGSIATDDIYQLLKAYMDKEGTPIVVKESCQVALDMCEYEQSGELDYTEPVSTTTTTTAPLASTPSVSVTA